MQTLKSKIKFNTFNFPLLFSFCFFLYSPVPAQAAGPIPQAGQSGIIEKSLRQSRPEIKAFPEEEQPAIIIEDSRTVVDPGAGPSFFVKKIEIEGNTLFDDETLAPMVDVGEGMDLTLGILSLMAQEITAHYASRGYFLSRAYIPRQEVMSGVVRLVVSEGKINKYRISGNKRTKEKDLLRRFKKVQKEGVLQEQTLEQVLMELNELMGVKVRSLLKPGELPGTSDLFLEVTETLPYTFSFDMDNFGSPYTGRDRSGLSFSRGNLFTLGDQLSFRGVKSNVEQKFGQGSYLFPFTDWGTTCKFSYTYSEQTLGANLSELKAGGDTKIFNLELGQTLHRTRKAQIKLKAGFDSKHFTNYQLEQTSSKESLLGFYLNLGGNAADRFLGRSFFDMKLFKGISEEDPNRDLASRAGGDGNITVGTLSFTRFQGTGFMNSYFIGKFIGQMTSSRSLSPYLFSVGGMGTVRGFPLSEYSGDNGYLLSGEYIFPLPWKLPLGFGKLTLNQVLSLTGFIDYGEVYVRNKTSAETDGAIAGSGGGIQVNIPKVKKWFPALSFSAAYAVPVIGPAPSDRSWGLWYMNGMVNYYW